MEKKYLQKDKNNLELIEIKFSHVSETLFFSLFRLSANFALMTANRRLSIVFLANMNDPIPITEIPALK